mgnify:CR=1 FL=1
MDPYGLFRFGKRPLEGQPWIPGPSSNPADDYFNTEYSHEHGFFEDGSGYNRGWRRGGPFSEDPTGRGYRYENKHYDDRLMREALDRLEKEYANQTYCFIGNNCQDFTQRWRELYNELLDKLEKQGEVCK